MSINVPDRVAIDTDEAARRLGVSSSLLEKYRCYDPEKGPPYFRIGRAVRYWTTALDAWAVAQTEGGGQ